MVKENG